VLHCAEAHISILKGSVNNIKQKTSKFARKRGKPGELREAIIARTMKKKAKEN
jgi:hypothetical protein